jgi:von Willebrand factor type A domain
MFFLLRFCLIFLVAFSLFVGASAQRPGQKRNPTPPPPPPVEEVPAEPSQDLDTLKTETNLVGVPVIATDRAGIYVPDLAREEFTITEDGVKHDVAFFATVSAPFHVVLMLDTSASTQEKLRLIREAAKAFVEQLQPADRVKVISFDQVVRDLNEFSNDRWLLRAAINKTKSGEGTKLYDAVEMALNAVRPITGRKAIVLFTDGVDWHSDNATFEATLRRLDEEGVLIYPIRYDTRAITEQIAREQASGPQLPTSDVIRRQPAPGTTPPTFPGGDEPPTTTSRNKTGPLGLPSAEEILRRRREDERRRDTRRHPDEMPDPTQTPGPERNPDDILNRRPSRSPGSDPSRDRRGPDDSISAMLDFAYRTADEYLKNLADKSGGKLLRADALTSLPDAFAKIAAELRTQYLLGYYPLNKDRDDQYRKIKVTTSRKDVVIRARPGYLASPRAKRTAR